MTVHVYGAEYSDVHVCLNRIQSLGDHSAESTTVPIRENKSFPYNVDILFHLGHVINYLKKENISSSYPPVKFAEQ